MSYYNEYKKLSKQPKHVQEANWSVKLPKPLVCDSCNNPINTYYQILILNMEGKGLVFYFHNVKCLKQFIDEQYKREYSKSEGMIY